MTYAQQLHHAHKERLSQMGGDYPRQEPTIIPQRELKNKAKQGYHKQPSPKMKALKYPIRPVWMRV